MFVASSLYNYATSSNATISSSSQLPPHFEQPTPANTRVKRRPKRGTLSSLSNANSPISSSTALPPSSTPLTDAETSPPGFPPPPPYASIATGATSEERKQAQDAKAAIVEEILQEEDLYKLLGCKKSAKPEEIRRGFLNRSRSCHPDKFPNHPPATSAFQKVSFAYETLSKPSSRRMYDVSGRSDFAAAMNTDAPNYSNTSAGGTCEDTLNGVLYSVFCEFMEGDFEMIRVLVNALNEGNPSMNLGEEAVDSIEGAFRRLREIMLAGKRYLSLIKFELMRLHEIQQSLRSLSYFNITGRLKLTIQLARVTLNIPLAIDQAMKTVNEADKANELDDSTGTTAGAHGDERGEGAQDDDEEEDEEEEEDEDEEEAVAHSTTSRDDFGIAPEVEEGDDDDDDDDGDGGSFPKRRSNTSSTGARKSAGIQSGRRAARGSRKGTLHGPRPRERIQGEGARTTARVGEEGWKDGGEAGAGAQGATKRALQKRGGLLPSSAVSLLKGVVKVLETSEAWMPGAGVPNEESGRP